MKRETLGHLISVILFCLAIIFVVISGYDAFQSGVAGDLKTGMTGNPQKALALERLSFNLSIGASLLMAAAFLFLVKLRMGLRIFLCICTAPLAFGAIWLACFYLQGLGLERAQTLP